MLMWIWCFWFQKQCTAQASSKIQVTGSDMDLGSFGIKSLQQFFVWFFFFFPVWNKNSFVILEICLQDWKDFSCACCLWSYISQCNYNIALMLSWSLLFWAAKHNTSVALLPAGSVSRALLSAWKWSNVWRTGVWWDLGWHFWAMRCAKSFVYISPRSSPQLLGGRDGDEVLRVMV